MRQLVRSCAYYLLALLFVSVLLRPSPVEAGIYDTVAEVTYKEYWVSHSQFTGGCGSLEVPEGGSWYLEPWPCTKTLAFEIPDDFSQASKVEIYLDLWRNHTGQSARFSLNEGPPHAPDVGYDWSRTPYIAEIPKSELQQGTNTITLWHAAGGYHVHDISFRIHYDDGHPLLPGSGSDVTPPDGQLTSIVASNGTFLPATGGTLVVDDDQVTLNATASGGDVKFVEFHAYYDGYDEDNDGEFLDWHNLGRNNFHPGGTSPRPYGGTIDHIGTDTGAPYAATWDLPHIQDQSGVTFKIRVVDDAGNVREAAGGVSADFTLSRTDTVETYLIPDFHDAVLHHGGTYPDIVTRFIDLPDDLSDVSQAYVIGAYWRNPYVSVNDNPQFTAFVSGEDSWALSIREIPLSYLQPGSNEIEYAYNSGFGEFIEEPGPMIVLRRTPPPPTPDESPPFTYGHNPAPGATNVDPASNVGVHVADAGTGVATTTLTMTVGGTSVTPAVTGDPSDYTLVYDPPVDLGADEVVPVTVDACDLDVPPHCMATEVYSFTVGMASLPVIDIWYGSTQEFGQIGTPQQWVNILGNVSDPDGVDSLVYSLNGGPELALSIGPDTRRLASEGDFNADLLYTDLVSGTNQVVITATDTFSRQSVETVMVEYISGSVWPAPYSIDWSTVTNVQDVARVVDGKWAVEGDSVHPVEIGYDRLVAIGDLSWTDYEVTVPITIHDVDFSTGPVSGGPGLGVLMRWTGHTDSPVSGWQPKSGWLPYGAIGWWRWTALTSATLQFHETEVSQSFVPALGVRYIFRIGVQSTPGQGGLYRLKVWEDGQSEPSAWNLTYQAGSSNLSHGSFMLLAHHVDASFGDVTVVPVGYTTSLTVTTVGSGTVAVEPDQSEYAYGQVVTLTATPEAGWTFGGWSGGLVGTSNPAVLTMTENEVVTATFTPDEYTLTVNTVGNGSVTVDPDQVTYHYGDVVTLTAIADAGWTFAGWSGDLSSSADPETIVITGDATVTATFTQDEYTLTINRLGNGRVDKDPDQATYRYGDVVTLTATAEPTWTFVRWGGDLSGFDNPKAITITGTTSVTATFRIVLLLPLVVTQ
jgi:uncharacterized repeat protein (TIGR02543 family)